MTAHDQPTEATDLFRRACEVMGYEIIEDVIDGEHCFPQAVIRVEDEPDVYLYDQWNILRLIVEWIEARRCDWETISGEGFRLFGARVRGFFIHADGDSNPLAAARWVCEHGPKIAKEETK